MNSVSVGGGGSVTVPLLRNKTASRSQVIPFFSTSPRPFGTVNLRVAIARSERESQAKVRDLPRTASETAELADRDREHRQARTWMKASILPLNSLRLKMERGLDFRILWGLGGRVGGLKTWSGSYDWYKNGNNALTKTFKYILLLMLCWASQKQHHLQIFRMLLLTFFVSCYQYCRLA